MIEFENGIEPRDFEEDLQTSGSTEFQPFWDYHYRQKFPEMTKRTYATTQPGVDWIVQPGDIKVDEKIRPDKDYGDVLLEYEHRHKSGMITPGWIGKDIELDWLAYGVYPADRVTWVDWPTLKDGWCRCGERWKENYHLSPAGSEHEGREWRTHNVAVTISELRRCGVIVVVTQGPAKSVVQNNPQKSLW